MGGLRIAAAFAPAVLVACTGDGLELGTSESAIDISAFVLPSLSELQRAEIVHRYDFLDPTDAVPRGLLEDTMLFFDVNKAHVPKTAFFVVVDLAPFSGKDRFWLVDLKTGAVEKHHVAHGDGSDPDNNGLATLFGNVDGSHMSSLGFYLSAEIYDGTHPHSMRLDGLSVDGSPNGMANTNVRSRLIVVHEASYVDDSSTSQQGRSNGCLALDPSIEVSVVDRIHDGTLLYVDTQALNTPVGRAACGDATCDGGETVDTCPVDCSDRSGGYPPPAPSEDGGGCSAGGRGMGMLVAFALVGLPRRRRKRR